MDGWGGGTDSGASGLGRRSSPRLLQIPLTPLTLLLSSCLLPRSQMVLETKSSLEAGVIGAGHSFAGSRLDAQRRCGLELQAWAWAECLPAAPRPPTSRLLQSLCTAAWRAGRARRWAASRTWTMCAPCRPVWRATGRACRRTWRPSARRCCRWEAWPCLARVVWGAGDEAASWLAACSAAASAVSSTQLTPCLRPTLHYIAAAQGRAGQHDGGREHAEHRVS